MRLEVDQETALIECRVLSVHTHEGRQRHNIRIFQDRLSQLLLMGFHRVERRGLSGDGNALNDTGVLNREEPLGDFPRQKTGQQQGCTKDQKRGARVRQYDIQRPVIRRDEPVGGDFHTGRPALEPCLGVFHSVRTLTQETGAHHRHERQGDNGGENDGDGQRQRKFVEQTPDHVAHEQQRDQHGDQRDG